MKVLLAEDNAVNRTLAKKLLEKRGHTIVVAENGRQALDILERESVDLVLMDVQMPEMDGLEATGAIREKEKSTGAHLPIIALTAHAMKGDRERCLGAGADGYVTKPINPAELFGVIDQLKPPTALPAATAFTAPVAETGRAFNLNEALKRVDGDRELLEEIIRIFVDEAPRIIAELHRAFGAGDHRLAERVAHTLKGSACNIAALAVSQSAAELESLAKAGNLPAAQALLTGLEGELKLAIAELESVARKVAH